MKTGAALSFERYAGWKIALGCALKRGGMATRGCTVAIEKQGGDSLAHIERLSCPPSMAEDREYDIERGMCG